MEDRHEELATVSRILSSHWKLVVGLGVLFALATLTVDAIVLDSWYEATAVLVVQAPPSVGGDSPRSLTAYREMIASDPIRIAAAERLVAEGALGRDEATGLAPRVTFGATIGGTAADGFLTVTARARNPSDAARIANTWADVFVERLSELMADANREAEGILHARLSSTREALRAAAEERDTLLNEFDQLEEDLIASWDARIVDARSRGSATVAAFESENRRLLAAAVQRHFPDWQPSNPDGATPPPSLSRLLSSLVAIHAELASTSRLVTLEKSASDETLAEMLLSGEMPSEFDGALTTQEIDPLYEELVTRSLETKRSLEREAGVLFSEVVAVIRDAEEITLQRGAARSSLLDEHANEIRALRRARTRAITELRRQRRTATLNLSQKVEQLHGVEQQLSATLAQTQVSDAMAQVPVVGSTARATEDLYPEPSRRALRVALAFLGGALLGFVVAAFRIASRSSSA